MTLASPSPLLQYPFYAKVVSVENDILNEALRGLLYNSRKILFDSNSVPSIRPSLSCGYVSVWLHGCAFRQHLWSREPQAAGGAEALVRLLSASPFIIVWITH